MSTATEQANRSGMDPLRLVVIFYLLFGIVLALFLDHVISMGMAAAGIGNSSILGLEEWKTSTLLGFALSIGLAAGAWFWPKTRTLSLEVASELMKVTWPSWSETRVSTIAVVFASIIASLILFAFDWFSYHVMVTWLPQLWGKL